MRAAGRFGSRARVLAATWVAASLTAASCAAAQERPSARVGAAPDSAAAAAADSARGKEPAPAAGARSDSVGGTEAGARGLRPKVIRDPRLETDSTLFPYEWPAFNALEETLGRLRPALETGEVRELAVALPQVEARVDTLVADSIPALLATHREELRGRMIVLRSAVARLAELAAAALAAPPEPAESEPMLEFGVDTSAGDDGLSGDTASGQSVAVLSRVPTETPPGTAPLLGEAGGGAAGPRAAGAVEAAAGGEADTLEGNPPDSASTVPDSLPPADSAAADSLGLEEADPVGAYLDAWRDVYFHAEAILHVIRNSAGEG